MIERAAARPATGPSELIVSVMLLTASPGLA
jgi:hypothetical protein